MSFDSIERSNYDGEPIALYDFSIGNAYWHYTSEEIDVWARGRIYRAIPISDSGSVQSGDTQNDDLRVTLPAAEPFVRLFLETQPAEGLWLTARRMHRGNTEAPVHWVGFAPNVKLVDSLTAEVTLKMLVSTFKRSGLRLSWSRQCPHALYDQNCRAQKELFSTAAQVDRIEGSSIVCGAVADRPTGYYSHGLIEWEIIPGVTERRSIDWHEENRLSIFGTTSGLRVGTPITVYAGCNRTSNQCKDKFNNLLNYGGFPHLPGKSPFSGDPVF